MSAELRAEGTTWVQVATVFRERYRLNARTAFRLIRGWSQTRAAEEWNKLWPDEPKTLKNFSAWELWPLPTGNEPSLATLEKLARLYECNVGDLLADLSDYRHLDEVRQATPATAEADSGPSEAQSGQPGVPLLDVLGNPRRLSAAGVDELAHIAVAWIRGLNPNINRREVLVRLSAALSLAAGAPLFDISGLDEHNRLERAVQNPSRVDAQALRRCEEILHSLLQQKNVLGAQATLLNSMALRDLVFRLAKGAPSEHRARALTLYAQATDHVGWLCFDMRGDRAAQRYFDVARSAAHDAGNTDLTAYILCNMSTLALWQGRPHVALDHAVAAQVRAANSGVPRGQAYAAGNLAKSLAADRRAEECRRALDRQQAALATFDPNLPDAPWWHFYDESVYWRNRSSCAVLLGDSADALKAADKGIESTDPANVYRFAFLKLDRSGALIQQREVAEASRTIGEVAGTITSGMWPRVDKEVTRLRRTLNPWQRSKPVRALDEILAAYRAAGAA